MIQLIQVMQVILEEKHIKKNLEKMTCMGIPTRVWKNQHMLRAKTTETKRT